MNIVIVILS